MNALAQPAELTRPDAPFGTMARAPDLALYCERHGLTMVTVGDLITHRRIANDEERMRWQWED